MDFILENQLFILLGVIGIGFIILGSQIIDLRKKISVLRKNQNHTSIDAQEDLSARIGELEQHSGTLNTRVGELESVIHTSVKKVGFLRFNPFHDTGGNNSFVVTLLDSKDNGVMISSLYTREGVRIYGKNIENGVTQYPLSDEETQTLKDTINK